MTQTEAHIALNPAETGQPSGVNRERLGMGVAVIVVALLGWLALWGMAADHAALEGGYGALGPGMTLFDDLARALGGGGLASDSLWGDICRALVSGGGTTFGAWPVSQFGIALLMWMVMAIAMMLPTAMPVIAAFGDIQSAARAKGMQDVPDWVFTSGYLAVWAALAVTAALIQWGAGAYLGDTPVLMTTAPLVGGGMLVFAGLYQWSALKAACLSQCRSPMRFFMTHWRDDRMGAFRMGLRHGLYCAGCCWALMALMFVGGTMNLVWMAVLTLVMLLEKLLPTQSRAARVFSHGAGIVFVAWGGLLLVSGIMEMGLFK